MNSLTCPEKMENASLKQTSLQPELPHKLVQRSVAVEAERKMKAFMAIPLLFLFFFLFSCFPCISYALIDYPTVTTANLSTTWKNSLHAGTTSELTGWVLADGSPVRPVFFVRDQHAPYIPPFAFGFFSNRTTNSTNELFYLVTFLLPRSDDDFILTTPVIVWVANRDRPVGWNATLNLTDAGDLQLRDADGTLAWSTNTGGLSVRSLNFSSEGGNLALLDHKNRVMWQSFDYPTDTWLPGQKLSYGKRLVASNSSGDVVPGQYYLSVTRKGIDAYVGSNPPIMYGARHFRFGLIRDETLGKSGSIQALSKYARFNLRNYSADGLRYIVLEPNGQLNVYQLDRVYSVLFNVILAGDLLAGPGPSPSPSPILT